MEGVLGIFQSVSNLNAHELAIYLQAYNEHQSFDCAQSKTKNVIQLINSLLVKATSRDLGLAILNEFLNQCPSEVFEDHAQLWTSCTIKSLNLQQINTSATNIFSVLAKISTRAKKSIDFSKVFSHTFLTKIYESFELLDAANCYAALDCLEVCLRNFPGPSGSSKTQLEKFLLSHIDTTDERLGQSCAKCAHLLLQVRGGGNKNSSYKQQWETYQLKLLGSIHGVFNEMFVKCREIYDMTAETQQLEQLPALSLSDEPAQRQIQLYIRLHNLLEYLRYALSEAFPAEKPIMPKRILNCISRGLHVSLNIVQRNAISDNLALGLLLPKMHTDLLQILRTLLLCMGSHMKMFHETVLSLLDDLLKGTASSRSLCLKPFAQTRIKTYEVLELWCSLMQGGSCCEAIGEHLVKQIMADIMPPQNDFILKVQNTTEKNVGKKMRKQAHKAQNMQSNIGQTHGAGAAKRSEVTVDANRVVLCAAALRCLQKLLITTGHMLKPATVNFMQKNIFQLVNTFYDLSPIRHELYNNWLCRLEMHNVLYAMQLTPHQLCPPPSGLIFDMLNKAHQIDDVLKIRQNCADLLLQLEKLIHPQKESLLFPIDIRGLRSELVARNHILFDNEDNDNEANDDSNVISNGHTDSVQEEYVVQQISEQLSREMSDSSILEDISAKDGDNSNCAMVLDVEDTCEATTCDDESFSKTCHLEVNLSMTPQEEKEEETPKLDNDAELLAPPLAKRAKPSEIEVPAQVPIITELPLTQEKKDNEQLLADLEAVFVDELF